MPLLSTACGLSFVFSSSFRFIAWITAISLASFFWFRASNSNLNQTVGVKEHKPISWFSTSQTLSVHFTLRRRMLKSTCATYVVNADRYFALLTCFWLSSAQLHPLWGCFHCRQCAVFLSSLAPGYDENITKWAWFITFQDYTPAKR